MLEEATLPACHELYEADYAVYSTSIEFREGEDCQLKPGVEVEVLTGTQSVGLVLRDINEEYCEKWSDLPTYVIGATEESGTMLLYVLVGDGVVGEEGQVVSFWVSAGGQSETVELSL